MTASEVYQFDPPEQTITITVKDKNGHPAAFAEVEIFFAGQLAGKVSTGPGVDEITVESVNVPMVVRATFSGLVQTKAVAPGQDSIAFLFNAPSLPYKAIVPPVAECPDGTTGSPCVTCREGNRVWRICT